MRFNEQNEYRLETATTRLVSSKYSSLCRLFGVALSYVRLAVLKSR